MIKKLVSEIKKYEKAVVAYSGGVDSTVLLKVARDILGEGAVALTGISPSFPSYDLDETKRLAREMGVKHIITATDEMNNSYYTSNPVDRCYHCKSALFKICRKKADELGIETVFDGSNLDDLGDYRPGFKAKEECGVKSPLIDAGLGKNDVREIAKELNLPIWNKPAIPCLASRFPYGTEITEERLKMVDNVEGRLKELGFKELRARFHGEIVRIEVGESEIERAISLKKDILKDCKMAGFKYVTLDLEGFRSGCFNELVKNRP